MLDAAAEVLGAVRREKTAQKRSMRARVATLTVVDRPEQLEALRQAEDDLREAGGIDQLALVEGTDPLVTVALAREDG